MNLQEEYIRRQGLTCPVILRPDKKTKMHLLFRGPKGPNRSGWALLNIESVLSANNPPSYIFKWFTPRYNSPAAFPFVALYPDQKVEWEQYEQEVISIARAYEKYIPVYDLTEVLDSFWEIFVYSCDNNLVSLPLTHKLSLWRSLDPDLPAEDRVAIRQSCIEGMLNSSGHNGIANVWNHLVAMTAPELYARWLADMIMLFRTPDSDLSHYCSLLDVA